MQDCFNGVILEFASAGEMQIGLSPQEIEIQQRAKAFTEKVLLPLEDEIEQGGTLPRAKEDEIRDGVRAYQLNAYNHAKHHGGQGMTMVEQVLVSEEIGKATNSLWYSVWVPPLCLRYGTDAQIENVLKPSCEGRIFTAYSITEPNAGSDVANVQTRADRDGDHFVITGEKSFASESEKADVVLLHALVDGDPNLPTIFLVDPKSAGFKVKRMPRIMSNTILSHPEITYEGLRVSEDNILGEVGQGFDLTKEWFIEARMYIAARCLGAAVRALEQSYSYASTRVAFNRPIRDFQALEFSFADMAVEVLAAKSMVYRIAAEIDAGTDNRVAHGLASAAKLYCSEMAGRIVDAALQVYGGRGYLRENPVNRLYRDVRADRIWEGTSEIQRAIVGKQLRRRGHSLFTGWPTALDPSENTDKASR